MGAKTEVSAKITRKPSKTKKTIIGAIHQRLRSFIYSQSSLKIEILLSIIVLPEILQ